jgi:hypothetical protein
MLGSSIMFAATNKESICYRTSPYSNTAYEIVCKSFLVSLVAFTLLLYFLKTCVCVSARACVWASAFMIYSSEPTAYFHATLHAGHATNIHGIITKS